jgi:ornithine cyclodeaminase/alanine dehydrogenase-like protein (mu-crystallin family)
VTLILTRRDVVELLSLDACIDAVEGAFRLHAEGRTLGPAVASVHAEKGGFHIKAAALRGEPSYFAAKTNANFPDNPRRFGLPTIQGTLVLADADNGAPLAVMDSASITTLRTGAATAVAARYLARRDARTVTVVGCGVQGEIQLAALAAVLPLERAWMVDADHGRAEQAASRSATRLGLRVEAAKDLRAALRESDVCVTCTPARRAFVAAPTWRRARSSPPSARIARASRSSSRRWWPPPRWSSTCSSSARRSGSSSTRWPPG